MPDHRLPKKLLGLQIKLADKGKECWGKTVKDALNALGLTFMWRPTIPLDKSTAIAAIKSRITDISRLCLIKEAQEMTSLVFYGSRKGGNSLGNEYDNLSPIHRRWLAIVGLNLKRSLPASMTDGAVKCKLCKQEISFSTEVIWYHYFIKGCSTVNKGTDFLENESYENVIDVAIKNSRYFVEHCNNIIKSLQNSNKKE
jgi:hypothetical protein